MNPKILIIGESCLDIYNYCKCQRFCPDRPVPILNVIKTVSNNGMAGNVLNNLTNLNVNCDIITNKNWKLNKKIRYVDDDTNHMFIRIDSEHAVTRIELTDKIIKLIKLAEIVIISDYNKGFLHENDIKKICSINENVFIDTKKQLGDWVNNAKIIKINNYEYNRSLLSISPAIKDKIIHTIGSGGCIYKQKQYKLKNKYEIKDTSGCGDTFMAALVAKYSHTRNIYKSINYANMCASEVARHKGVTVYGK